MIEGLRLSWDHIFKDFFSFRNGPFGFEIIEILISSDWLGVVTFDSDSDYSNCVSEVIERSETKEKLAVAHQEFAELPIIIDNGQGRCREEGGRMGATA